VDGVLVLRQALHKKVTSAETFLAQRRKDAKKTLRTAAALGAFAPLREKNFLEVRAASIFCAKLLCVTQRSSLRLCVVEFSSEFTAETPRSRSYAEKQTQTAPVPQNSVMGQFKKHVLPQRRKVAKKTAASFGFSWRLCVFAGGS
jgi:hypothetical protein